MIDLIDRKRLLYEFTLYPTDMSDDDYDFIERLINSQQTINPIQHAHWQQHSYFDEDNGVFQCSNCKEEFVLISGSPKENGYNYCPHCGCKMEDEE